MDKQLSHFIGIIEAGGLAAAADHLNIGQPALTASLKKAGRPLWRSAGFASQPGRKAHEVRRACL